MTSINDKENIEGFDSANKKDELLLANEYENEDLEGKGDITSPKEDSSNFTDENEENYQGSDFSPTTFNTKPGKPEPGIQKTFSERFFSPVREGSIRSSIFAIASVCLGMGTMAMPSAFSKISLLGGIIFLCFGACLGYWSLCILIESSRKLKTTNYSDSVKESFGPIASKILDFSILFNSFGNLLGYMITSKFNYYLLKF